MVFAACGSGCGVTLLREGGEGQQGQQGTGTEPRGAKRDPRVKICRGETSSSLGKGFPIWVLGVSCPFQNLDVPLCHRRKGLPCSKPLDVPLLPPEHKIPWLSPGQPWAQENPESFLHNPAAVLRERGRRKQGPAAPHVQAPGRLSFRDLLRQELHQCLRALGVLFRVDLSDSLLNLSIFLVTTSSPPTQCSMNAPIWSLPC